MDLFEIIGSSAAITVFGGIAYVVNKWIIPFYKGLLTKIEALEQENKTLIQKVTNLEIQLATLKERYAEKTVLKSGRRKAKSNE